LIYGVTSHIIIIVKEIGSVKNRIKVMKTRNKESDRKIRDRNMGK